jgi:hypothetical protein
MVNVQGRMPALFVGHGNPMNALEDNAYTRGWRAIGQSIPRPRAVVCVSAHWYIQGTRAPCPQGSVNDCSASPRPPRLLGRCRPLPRPGSRRELVRSGIIVDWCATKRS